MRSRFTKWPGDECFPFARAEFETSTCGGRYVRERLEEGAWCPGEKSGPEIQVWSHRPLGSELMFWLWSAAPRRRVSKEEQPGRSPEAPPSDDLLEEKEASKSDSQKGREPGGPGWSRLGEASGKGADNRAYTFLRGPDAFSGI